MSMADLTRAFSLVEASPSRSFFAGPRDPELVLAAENVLGGRLPPTYREFVSRLGAGNFGSFEAYGVIDDNFEHSAVPNGVWLTLNERRGSSLPKELVVIGSTGDGSYYCIELRDGEESPVIVYQPGFPAHQQHNEVVAKDFGELFLNQIRSPG